MNASLSYGFASLPQLLVHGVDLVDSVDLVRGEQPPACRRHAHTRPYTPTRSLFKQPCGPVAFQGRVPKLLLSVRSKALRNPFPIFGDAIQCCLRITFTR
jgi:hypothetical protein